jgi:hypothetical protein
MKNKFVFPKEIYFKNSITKIEDVDEKGVVKFWFSRNGIQDGYKHVGNQGMFQKSINERISQIMHHKNHDTNIMPGVLTELLDLPEGGSATSKLILSTRDGLETYEQYKAMAEAGKSMPHSYHFDFVKPTLNEAIDAFINEKELQLREVVLLEVSTLTKDACNPLAVTQTIKSLELMSPEDLIIEDGFYKALLNSKFDNATLENLQKIKDNIEALIVKSRATTRQAIEPLFGLKFLTN